MKKIALHWQVIIALILGVIYAVFAIENGWNDFTRDFIAPFGEIFVRVLKLIAIPLVLFSIISGIGALKNIKQLGSVGVKTLLIYLGTTMSAIIIGLLVVNSIKPGTMSSENSRLDKRIEYELWLADHPNVVRLDDVHMIADPQLKDRVKTVQLRMATADPNEYLEDKLEKAKTAKEMGPLGPLVDIFPDNILKAMMKPNMMQIIFFAIFFGVILLRIPRKKSKPARRFVASVNEVFIEMVNVVIRIMPIFVFALMAGGLVKSAGDNLDKLLEELTFLSWYSLAVVIALAFVAFVFYPFLIKLFTKKMGFKKFMKGISQAQLTAFSTSSSMATLPVTMDAVHDELEVPKSISSFVLPIGATVNMDGTSLYQAVAVVALAQFHMVDLGIAQQLTIVLFATVASIGAAAIPSAGLVLMIAVLQSVGLNPAWIAVILPVDRILDMCRTVVNVTGDAAVSTIVASSEGVLGKGND